MENDDKAKFMCDSINKVIKQAKEFAIKNGNDGKERAQIFLKIIALICKNSILSLADNKDNTDYARNILLASKDLEMEIDNTLKDEIFKIMESEQKTVEQQLL